MPFIYGEEVEYGLMSRNPNEDDGNLGALLFTPFPDATPEKGVFVSNGSRFYVDRGHPEMATPECVHPRDLLLWAMANDLLLMESKKKVEHLFRRRGRELSLEIIKNNTDSHISYGCHENYMISQRISLESIIPCLMPFLVTRQIFCGAGSICRDESGGVHFEISQRARFMHNVKSATPTFDRGIISTRQIHETFTDGPFQRLHLIVADSNMSETSHYLRTGTTGLVLEMVEKNFLNSPVPDLEDPIESLRMLSFTADPYAGLKLADGRRLNAIEVQGWYAEKAHAFLEKAGQGLTCFSVLKDVWERWVRVLEGFRGGQKGYLGETIDWVIKKRFMDYLLARHGRRWDGIDEETYKDMKEWDIRYHCLNAGGNTEGLYYFLKRKGKVRTILKPGLVLWAKDHPPRNTRAFARGTLVRELPQLASHFSWDELEIAEGAVYRFPDPLNPYESAIKQIKKDFLTADACG